jgi:hypothetical protein
MNKHINNYSQMHQIFSFGHAIGRFNSILDNIALTTLTPKTLAPSQLITIMRSLLFLQSMLVLPLVVLVFLVRHLLTLVGRGRGRYWERMK